MQLLKITTVPLKLKINTEMAKLQMNRRTAQMRQNSKGAKLRMSHRDTKVAINTYPSRKRLGLLNMTDFSKAASNRGEEGALRAMAQYSELGNKLAMAHKGVTVAQAAYKSPIEVPPTETAFQPGAGAQFEWSEAQLDVKYEAAKLNINWDNSSNKLEYVPGKFQVEVEQYPDIEIEYLGKPSYVPPSAEPGYAEEKD